MLNHPKLLFNELVQVLPEKSSKPIIYFFSSLSWTSFLSTFSNVFSESALVLYLWALVHFPGVPVATGGSLAQSCVVTRSSGVSVGDAQQPREGCVGRPSWDWKVFHPSNWCGGLTMEGSSGERFWR